ncbi:hypothetical protein Salat_2397600 [Sesamum alatum]|uniref:Uncharacterized protein n=1 Tax=Sesamum alatum TaxID=300844 RepID=A0AAE1XYC6_9LAMI|nr:hypothetical protein Salat_2397600 [Sesamum alatum]
MSQAANIPLAYDPTGPRGTDGKEGTDNIPNLETINEPSENELDDELNLWTRHEAFLSVVERTWGMPASSYGMDKLAENLRRNIFANIKVADEVVAEGERLYDTNPSDMHLMEMNCCTDLLQHAPSIEEDL